MAELEVVISKQTCYPSLKIIALAADPGLGQPWSKNEKTQQTLGESDEFWGADSCDLKNAIHFLIHLSFWGAT